ncbi:hypothetical protein BCR34DRAFT_603423 [Clohesyomyces aquaticus]|uniref:Uncharacterized protein n=1 Tax=Clohesyomyces aquaticus TaxID=1231657 RepID=A0A1Y1ZEF9_9PLEO|nr:hypothetical protein BCR34DRAFT_603423 [Clohesyomyces aquaticus]
MAIGRDKNTSSSNWENVTVFNPADGTFSVQPTRGNIPDEPLFANLLDTAAYCTFGEADRLHDRYDIFVYGAFRGTSNIYILTLPAFQWISVPSSQMPYQPEATCTGTGNGQMIIIWRIMSYQLIDHELGGPFGASQEIFEFFDEQFGNLGIFNLSSFETSRLYDAKAGPYISPEIVRAFYRTSPLTPSWLHPDVKNLLKPKRFPRSIRNPNFLSSFCIGILASSALLLCCRVFFDLIRRLILPNSGGPPEDTNLKNSSITTKGYGGVAVEDMISLTTGHSPTSLTAIFRSASGSLASILCETVISLYYRYGAERPIPPNHTRVRWTCACGEALFDDYLEYREGAARLLEARLNRTQSHPVTPETSSSASGRGSVASISSTVTTPIPIPSNYGFSSPREKVSYRTLFNYQGQHEALGIQLAPKRECWLLSCANEKGLTPGLSHLDVDPSKVFTDMDLAIAMREMYRKQVKKSWLGIFRLRGLSKIEFVQFFVHENRFADIRKVPDMPPIGRDYDYDFEPIELCPPIGSTFLLHLIKHPSDYENERITYSLLPKRKRKLSFGVGWGLHLAVGFLERRIWIAMLVILIIGGMVFGVTWSVKKADLQGAFTFAGFAVTLATFVLGALQSWIDERNSLLLQ